MATSERDLLALSIIGARYDGIDTTRAENALDRMDQELGNFEPNEKD